MIDLSASMDVSHTTLHRVDVKFMSASECNINNVINMLGIAQLFSLNYNIVK